MAPPKLNLIAAQCIGGGIGKNNAVPWNLKREYAHFARMTRAVEDESKQNVVLMGRRTWESIGSKPLKGRINAIVSSTMSVCPDGCVLASSIDEALSRLSQPPYLDLVETVWVVGGVGIYREAISHPRCFRIYLTQIEAEIECDTFFPSFDESDFEAVVDSRAPSGPQVEDEIQWECRVLQKKRISPFATSNES